MQADLLIEAKPLCVQAELRRSGYGQPLCTAIAPELQVAAVAVSFDLGGGVFGRAHRPRYWWGAARVLSGSRAGRTGALGVR